MKCSKCEQVKSKYEMVYHKPTLNVMCNECCTDGVALDEIDDHLEKHFPEVDYLKNKAVSTRLPLHGVVYLLKYAQKHEIPTISRVIQELVAQMQKIEPLHKEQLGQDVFKSIKHRMKPENNGLKVKQEYLDQKAAEEKAKNDKDVFLI